MRSGFVVDLTMMDDVVGELEKCEGELAELAADLDRQLASLHASWCGLAALSQQVAQDRWREGLAHLRSALAELRAAARAAHEAYESAVSTNVAMWRQLA